MKRVICALVCLVALCSNTQAQSEKRWVRFANPPQGGRIIDMTINHSANKIYVLSEMNGVFISEDKGIHWKHMQDDILFDNLTSLSVEAENGTLLVGTLFRGLHWTKDDGVTWDREPFGTSSTSGMNAYIQASVVKPGGGIMVCNEPLIGTSNMHCSENGGITWSTFIAPFGIANRMVLANDGAILAATENGIYRSANDGHSWSPRNSGMNMLNASSVIAGGGESDVWAGVDLNRMTSDTSNCGVYFSADDGLTWERRLNGLADKRVSCVAYTAGTVYAATPSGIYRSTDEGATWSAYSTGLEGNILAVNTDETDVYAGSGTSGAFHINEGDLAWEKRNDGLKVYLTTESMVFDKDDALHILDYNTGTYSYNESGISQHQVNGMGQTLSGRHMIKDAAGNLYVTVLNDIYRSADNGHTWESKKSGLPFFDERKFDFLGIGHSDNVLYLWVGYHNFGEDLGMHLYASENGGDSWHNIFDFPLAAVSEYSYQNMAVSPDDKLYFGVFNMVTGEAGILRSSDSMASTEFIEKPATAIVFFPDMKLDRNGVPYLIDQNVLYWLSDDDTWEMITGVPWATGSTEGNIDLYFDNENNKYVVQSEFSVAGSVYYSDGEGWGDLSSSIPVSHYPFISGRLVFSAMEFDEENQPYGLVNFYNQDTLCGVYYYTDRVLSVSSPDPDRPARLEVFPNPVDNLLSFHFQPQRAEEAYLRIFDINGRQVSGSLIRLMPGKEKYSLEVPQLSPGVYITELVTRGQRMSNRIIKL